MCHLVCGQRPMLPFSYSSLNTLHFSNTLMNFLWLVTFLFITAKFLNNIAKTKAHQPSEVHTPLCTQASLTQLAIKNRCYILLIYIKIPPTEYNARYSLTSTTVYKKRYKVISKQE